MGKTLDFSLDDLVYDFNNHKETIDCLCEKVSKLRDLYHCIDKRIELLNELVKNCDNADLKNQYYGLINELAKLKEILFGVEVMLE